MTARQLRLLFNEAMLAQTEQHAHDFDAVSFGLTGQASPVAKQIRKVIDHNG